MSNVKAFEELFRKFTGSRYAIACCNGTAALHTAVTALGIGEGDKVVTTPFSFIASSNCILYNHATPVFADIDSKTYCIDVKEVEKQVLSNIDIKAILCVHLFGNTCDLKRLTELAKEHKLWLIEDCAQALGARVDGKHVGTFGDIGTFSFYATKNLWTFEGGMLITDRHDLAEKARMIINHGQSKKYQHVILGYNYRLSEIQALIGLTMLKLHAKSVLSELGSYGIKDGYYPQVIYNQPYYKHLGIKGNCPIAEKIAAKVKRESIR